MDEELNMQCECLPAFDSQAYQIQQCVNMQHYLQDNFSLLEYLNNPFGLVNIVTPRYDSPLGTKSEKLVISYRGRDQDWNHPLLRSAYRIFARKA